MWPKGYKLVSGFFKLITISFFVIIGIVYIVCVFVFNFELHVFFYLFL